MQIFELDQFDNHERVVFVNDEASGLKAIIALHNTNLGPAIGGCRAWAYPTNDAAVVDVLRLSRGMTYKAACAGLPYGGGKSVILLDPRKGKSPEMMAAMGRAVESLNGSYVTGEDVGTTVTDMSILQKYTSHVLGTPGDLGGSGDPSPSTALGCFYGIQAAVKERFGRSELSGLKVAVQGLGNVGWFLSELLHRQGAVLTVSDIRGNIVQRAVDKFGATAVGVDEIFGADVDVFAPCALGAAISDRTIPQLRAKVVAGGANNQLTEVRHAESLAARDILYAPDYVINAGGVIQLALEKAGKLDELAPRLGGIALTLKEIFAVARELGISTAVAADRFAEKKFKSTGVQSQKKRSL